MRTIDADKLCVDLMERWDIADKQKEELVKRMMADIVTPIVVSQPPVHPDYDCVLKQFGDCTYDTTGCSDCVIKAKIKAALSAQPEIIRCKDCKYWREHKYTKETKRYIPFCGFNAIYTQAEDFCSRAERRTDEQAD